MVTIMVIYFYMTYDFTLIDICSDCFDNENLKKIVIFQKVFFIIQSHFLVILNKLKNILNFLYFILFVVR